MSDSKTPFVGSVPEKYDSLLGPFLFEFAAKDLVQRLNGRIPDEGKLLEIAAGTGVSTEHIRNALPPSIEIVATDLQDAMLDIARKKRGNLQNVTYQQADALDLPFDDAVFDAVVAQFGIMFFPDKEKGMQEMVRVIKQGGSVAINVWDSFEHNKVVDVVFSTVAKFFADNPPPFIYVPFGYHDIDAVLTLMQNAGLKNVEHEVVPTITDSFSARHIAEGLIAGSPVVAEIEDRGTADVETIISAAERSVEKVFGVPPKVSLQEIVFVGEKE